LFTELRAALIAEFDDIGFQKTVMMDFETAAHNALQQVFPEWTIKTCYFHFVKSVSTQVEKKVHEAVRSRAEFKHWLNQILGMFCWTILLFVTYLGSVFLPIDDARRVFNHLLSNLPPGINISQFVQYLRRFWLPKLDKVICWDNTQPRTNNPAEAYHSKLRSAFER
jgi:hypothetical protein